MRQLLPNPAEVNPREAYGRVGSARSHRPAIRLNMVSSIDGAATLEGRSGGLSNAADKALFMTLRSLADVILVGAATARDEGYRPVKFDADITSRRRAEGLPDVPTIAVITRTCHLDFGSALFIEADPRPIVITVGSASATNLSKAAEVAEVIVAGDEDFDFRVALDALAARTHTSVLCEGGPAIAAQLASADLLDEVCLTLSPLLAGGQSKRIVDGPALVLPSRFGLAQVLEADDSLFLRYQRHDWTRRSDG